MHDSFRRVLRTFLLVLLAVAPLLGGCAPADDKSSLVQRTSNGLLEVGASSALTKCLTDDLEGHLTDADAEIAYEDLSSEPEVSEVDLNRVSLLEKTVKQSLLSRAHVCRKLLTSQGRYTSDEVDRMLRHVGKRAYRNQDFFFEG